MYDETQHNPTRAIIENGGVYTDLPDLCDADFNSSDPFVLLSNDSFLLLGYDASPFNVLYAFQGSTKHNTVTAALHYGYSAGGHTILAGTEDLQ